MNKLIRDSVQVKNILFSKTDSLLCANLILPVAIHIALEKESHDILSLLLQYIKNKNNTDENKNNDDDVFYPDNIHAILNSAAATGFEDVIKYLISNGFSANESDERNSFPLHFACREGRTNLAKFLLEIGTPINCKNNKNETPLLLAALNGHIEIVNLLISEGANLVFESTLDESPLFCAVKYGHLDIVTRLLECGAIFSLDEQGASIFEVAFGTNLAVNITLCIVLFLIWL